MPGLENLQGRLRAWQEQLAGAWPQLQSLLDTPGTLAASTSAQGSCCLCASLQGGQVLQSFLSTLVRVDILTVQTAVMRMLMAC